jgi:hypothetical protein
MTPLNVYTSSISPESLSIVRNEQNFSEFMEFFEKECNLFIDSCPNVGIFLSHFLKIIGELASQNVDKDLLKRIDFHSRLTEYRVSSIDDFLNILWIDYKNKNDQTYLEFRDKVNQPVSLPPTEDELAGLSQGEKEIVQTTLQKLQSNYIRLIAGVGGFINTIFFAFEAQCKIICSLGCYPFSIRYAQDNIITHGEIWKSLRRLGKVDGLKNVECQICSLRNSCNSELNFRSLANVYCFAIKVRMLSDYEEFFYSYDKTWEKLKLFFDNIKLVIGCEQEIKQKCFGMIQS